MATKTAFDIVIFGGGGDLSLRKLMSALYRGFAEGSIDSQSRIIPTCRDTEVVQQYREHVSQSLQAHLSHEEYNDAIVGDFLQLIFPCVLDITALDKRWDTLQGLYSEDQNRARIFYMAVPSSVYGKACENLNQKHMITSTSRIVVEKPIGYDGVTASLINDEVAKFFPEPSIFRIDHYLGKETVQNLMALRFTNVIFEQLWDAKSIDHVQISLSETVGLEGRAGFYENTGALRDMVQNHALQLLCLVAMESPNKLDANSIRAEKVKVLEALRPLTGKDVDHYTVRGQYVAGEFDGQLVPGYLEELDKPSSDTETFVAIKAHIDNWRWSKVPFYLRTGKRMKARSAKIVIQFKEVSHRVYEGDVGPLTPNQLIIKLQPGESIQLSLMTKDLSCLDTQLKPVSLNLNFSDTYGHIKSDAYKRLILDVAANNPALFIHRDEVDAAWRWIDPIIQQWQQSSVTPDLYRAGSWGPSAARQLMEEDGRCWFNGED